MFSPRPLDTGSTGVIKNPKVTVLVRAKARSLSAAGTSEDLNTLVTRTVRIETNLRLDAFGTYYKGPFKNSGALPPVAEKPTTYTVSLVARNSSNNVSGAVVKTTLPIYVTWLNKIYPEGESLKYDSATSEVTWDAGRIPSGGTREAFFQVSFLPSLIHLNTSPRLTGDIVLVGTDDFTKTTVKDQRPAVTTQLSSDPQFSQNQANVVN